MFTAQVWIRTTTTTGGRILGFGDLQTGNSGHRDRHIYMNNAGQLIFGVRAQDDSTAHADERRAYNDNQWHQITATMSPAGMQLYVDGVQVGQPHATRPQGEAYLGYWRVGGDNIGGWPSAPEQRQLRERLRRRGRHLPDGAQPGPDRRPSTRPGRATAPDQPAADGAFTATHERVVGERRRVGVRRIPDGTIAGYSWNWGDGTTPASTGTTASHPYAAAGTYTVTLTVTDNQGATDTETKPVTVTAPPTSRRSARSRRRRPG